MSVLDEICANKAKHVAAKKTAMPICDLRARLDDAKPTRGFVRSIKAAHARGTYGLICEIKKASPSKGLIRADFHPASLAQAYHAGGATCLSVLTDEPYFQGKDDYLAQARAACPLPALRKDFMIDAYQIDESRFLGADCILLIMAALSDTQAQDFEGRALELGMDVLVEVHDKDEMERAKTLKSPLLGVNNRNLKTMVQSIQGRIPVSESSLSSPDDLKALESYGYSTFLIGETFMRKDDVTAAVRSFQKGVSAS